MSAVKPAQSKAKSGIPQLKKPESPRQTLTSKLRVSSAVRRTVDGASLLQPQEHGGVTGIGAGGSVPAANCPALRPHTSNPAPHSKLPVGKGRPKSASRSFAFRADDDLRSQSCLDKAFWDVAHSNKTSVKSKASPRANAESQHNAQNTDVNRGAVGHAKKWTNHTNRRILESTFMKKKKDFQKLKIELSAKQQMVLELLAAMKDVYKRMSGKSYLETDLRVIDVGSWNAVELARLCKSSNGEGEAPNKLSLGPQIVSQLSHQLASALDKCLDLCRDAIDKRKAIIQKLTASSPSFSKEIDTLLQEWEKDELNLAKSYGDTSSDTEKMVNEVVEVIRSLYNERLQEEEKNQILISELNILRKRPDPIKPFVSIDESQSQKFDVKQRAMPPETRVRKLATNAQNAEAAATELMRQRDMLQARVRELHESLEERKRNDQSEAATRKAQTEAERLRSATERARAEVLERRAIDAERRCDELEQQAHALTDARDHVRDAASPSGNGSEREAELWAELQRTRTALRVAEEDIRACQREKVHFIGTLAKIAESEKKISFRDKITSELVIKEEQVQNLESQLREANILAKTSEEKYLLSEKEINDLKMQLTTARNESNLDTECTQSQRDLQQEILHLRVNVTELVTRNGELADVIGRNKMAIEQQDRVYNVQSKVIKVRDELIRMLKNPDMKQTQCTDNCQMGLQSNHQRMEDVNEQILQKTDEFQQLFSTLEQKEQQIFRLEKIVSALEEQQKRCYAQRARQEEKISLLEHELREARTNKTEICVFLRKKRKEKPNSTEILSTNL